MVQKKGIRIWVHYKEPQAQEVTNKLSILTNTVEQTGYIEKIKILVNPAVIIEVSKHILLGYQRPR